MWIIIIIITIIIISPGGVLVEVDLGVLVTSSPGLLQSATLDRDKDDDHGGEDAHDHRGDPDGDEVLLLEPLLHHVLVPG